MACICAIDLSQITHQQVVPAIHIQRQEDIASIVATVASTLLLAVDTIIGAVKVENQRLGWLVV